MSCKGLCNSKIELQGQLQNTHFFKERHNQVFQDAFKFESYKPQEFGILKIGLERFKFNYHYAIWKKLNILFKIFSSHAQKKYDS